MFKTYYFIFSPGLKLDFWATWWWLTRWRERFRPSDVDFYSQMTFSDCKMALSLNLELKNVKGNFIWSLVLALTSTLISTSALTLSLKFILNWGRETLHSVLMKMTAFSDIYCEFFDFNPWNNDFRLYESMSLGRNLSLHLVNHHQNNIIISSYWDHINDLDFFYFNLNLKYIRLSFIYQKNGKVIALMTK